MLDKVEATDQDREKNIKKDLQEMKQRYDTVNSKLGNLETRMDTMSRDQAESSCAIQSKLDAILRNSWDSSLGTVQSWNRQSRDSGLGTGSLGTGSLGTVVLGQAVLGKWS